MARTSHKIADLLRSIVGLPPVHRYTTAIIAAAGSSSRMGSDESKLLLDLDGMPVLARTLSVYQMAESIDEIILVARREDFDRFIALAKQYRITKLKRITQGGEDRQSSVLRGLEVASDKTEFVAIGDGARCLTTPAQIDLICRTAYRTSAASAATPAVDTVKLVDATSLPILSRLVNNAIPLNIPRNLPSPSTTGNRASPESRNIPTAS